MADPRRGGNGCPDPAPGLSIGIRSLAYQAAPLFERLRFRLEGGSWTCLLGPSGVGKTSLLRLTAGLAAVPGRGRRWRRPGRPDRADGAAGPAAALAVRARQRAAGPPAARGVACRAAPAGGPAPALLARVGLERDTDRLPGALSGGMRQRAALARTLMEDRPIVLMDEPFSALDVVTRHRLQDLAAELLVGRTVLLVTHNPIEASGSAIASGS